MKVRKNLEAVFLAAVVMVSFVAYATAEVPGFRAAKPAPQVVSVGEPNMAVVVVTGKRLTAAEKAALN